MALLSWAAVFPLGVDGVPVREGLVAWFDAATLRDSQPFSPASASAGWWWNQWEGSHPFLRVAGGEDVGPLSLPGVMNQPRGTGFFTGGSEPDLLVRSTGFPGVGLYLFPFSGRSPEGVPVFGAPRPIRLDITHPLLSSGSIFPGPDGSVRAAWIEGGFLVFGRFENLNFSVAGRVPVDGLPRTAVRVAILPDPDGSLEAIFEVSDGVRFQPDGAGPGAANYEPYDGAGIWQGGMPYRHLWAASLPAFAQGPAVNIRQLSATEQEVLLACNQLAPIVFGSQSGVITGSAYGALHFFAAGAGGGFQDGREIAGIDGTILRHRTAGAAVVVYPDPETGRPDLIVGGDGALYFYRFNGTFTSDGRPVYEAPVPLLQQNADLYAGSMPVASVVDWDGDGRLDLVAGNSEGRVLLFRNAGSNAEPSFLAGEPVWAGGREIHIQAGYRGSLQGVGEARYGFAAPVAIDWTGNGSPDLVMGDISGSYSVYVNRGVPGDPQLDRARPILVDGLELHGKWRVQPAVARLGERMAMVIVDAEDHLHLYWQIDPYNVESGGKLRLENGTPISISGGFGVNTGRVNLTIADWDQDGVPDLLIGASETNAIPNRATGLPANGLPRRTAAILFLKNTGTAEEPVFAQPVPLRYNEEIFYPGGGHATAVATTLGGGAGPNLLVGNQTGRFILLPRSTLSN